MSISYWPCIPGGGGGYSGLCGPAYMFCSLVWNRIDIFFRSSLKSGMAECAGSEIGCEKKNYIYVYMLIWKRVMTSGWQAPPKLPRNISLPPAPHSPPQLCSPNSAHKITNGTGSCQARIYDSDHLYLSESYAPCTWLYNVEWLTFQDRLGDSIPTCLTQHVFSSQGTKLHCFKTSSCTVFRDERCCCGKLYVS